MTKCVCRLEWGLNEAAAEQQQLDLMMLLWPLENWAEARPHVLGVRCLMELQGLFLSHLL